MITTPTERDWAALLQKRIIEEIAVALGFPRKLQLGWLIAPLFQKPAHHFSNIAMRFDQATANGGISSGARCVLTDFSLELSVRRSENIPKEGPLLIVSNHPGAYDSLGIMASIPRNDLAIVLSDTPFSRALTAAQPFFFYVPPEVNGRMEALRNSIRHLQKGGAVLIFAHGQVEPDPAFMPGSEQALLDWSPSIEIMLRKVPSARLQLVITSNVLLPRFVKSMITKIRRQPYARQKLAEFLQVSTQMVWPKKVKAYPRISFAESLTTEDLPKKKIDARYHTTGSQPAGRTPCLVW